MFLKTKWIVMMEDFQFSTVCLTVNWVVTAVLIFILTIKWRILHIWYLHNNIVKCPSRVKHNSMKTLLCTPSYLWSSLSTCNEQIWSRGHSAPLSSVCIRDYYHSCQHGYSFCLPYYAVLKISCKKMMKMDCDEEIELMDEVLVASCQHGDDTK